MSRREVEQNHNILALEELARQLPTDEARTTLFNTAESLMHIAAGKAVMIGALGALEPHTGKTKEPSNELDEWTGYLAKQAQKYQG